MAIAFVVGAHVTEGSGANGGTSGSIDTSGANFLVVSVGSYSGGDTTITDSKSNNWTQLTPQDETQVSLVRSRIWYAKNAIVGSGHTFSDAVASSFPSFCVAAFSGVDTSSPFDQQNGAHDAGGVSTTGISTGSVTPTSDNQLIIAGLAVGSSTATPAIDGGFTRLDFVNFSASTYYGSALAYLIQTSAAAANPFWDTDVTNTKAATIATFKAAAGGGGGVFNPYFYRQHIAGGMHGESA